MEAISQDVVYCRFVSRESKSEQGRIWTPEAGMAASGLSSLEVAAWAGAVECVISPVGTAACFFTYYEYRTSILECSLPNQAADVGLQAA